MAETEVARVRVFVNPNPTPEPPPPKHTPTPPKALDSRAFPSRRSPGAPSGPGPLALSRGRAGRVGFPDAGGYFRGPRGRLSRPFRRRGWFIVLILTSLLPRRNEGEGQDAARVAAAFPHRPPSCFGGGFYYAGGAPPTHTHTLVFLLCAVNCQCRLSAFSSPSQSAFSLRSQNIKP